MSATPPPRRDPRGVDPRGGDRYGAGPSPADPRGPGGPYGGGVPPGRQHDARPGDPRNPGVRRPHGPGYPPQGAPQQRAVEPTKVLRRDQHPGAGPLAYSQAGEEPPTLDRGPRYAPTQQPEPFAEHRPDQRARGSRRATPPPPPAAPPRRSDPVPGPARRRRKRHPFRWFLVFLLVLLIGSVAGVVHLDGKLTRIDALAGYPDRVGDTPGTNWLLVGSDGRSGLTAEQEQELATGGEVGPERTDTIMLVHIPKSGATTLVSLPRDSYVSIPGYGRDKLNASFALGGPQLLVQTVEIATGLRIDNYAQIGFAGFADVVDALDGIDICLPQAIDDPLAGINLPAGCQHLSGPEALGFVRTRATALADIDRMNNQRLFLSALLQKATSTATLANPFRLWPLASGTAKSLKVDEGDHLWDLGKLGWAMRGDTIATTVPVGGFDDVSGSGNVLLWDTDKAIPFFEALADDKPIPEALLTR
ncbi:LCP family protein [Nocardia higoensis]|uniref:LCP family protein n=1 Tax=Nocardia higoensis TaxID=228599 RepID=UPI001FDF1F1F|nr:LCP family protein [Nocardia higoensis]